MLQYHREGLVNSPADSDNLCRTYWQDDLLLELLSNIRHRRISIATGEWIREMLMQKAATRRRGVSGNSSPSMRHALPTAATTHKLIGLLTFIFVGLLLWNDVFQSSYATLPRHYQNLERRVRLSAEPGRGNLNNEKVFIAANIVDESLVRGAWGNNLVTLVDLLGEDNVFVSIYENDSGPGTSIALRELQQRLPCNSSVVTGDHVPLSDFPTVHLPSGEERVQRLTYLAEIRNRLLRPIDPLYANSSLDGFRKATHISFDKILFLNDVYYSPLEAVHLLFSTNAESGSAKYRAACALDFVHLFKLYDTFVVRDTDGYSVPLQVFPWFTGRGSGSSRQDVLNLSDAVRVRSCWGGMAAFDARVFQPKQSMVQDVSQHDSPGLRLTFRSNNELFWETAECCLIFADMEVKYGRSDGMDGHGVFVNPYIRTAYSAVTWSWLPFFKRFERVFSPLHRLRDGMGPPENNPRRTHEPGQTVSEMVWVQAPRAGRPPYLQSVDRPRSRIHPARSQTDHFELQIRQALPGGFCGERRMFVMKRDVETANRSRGGRNWANIRVPTMPSLGHT